MVSLECFSLVAWFQTVTSKGGLHWKIFPSPTNALLGFLEALLFALGRSLVPTIGSWCLASIGCNMFLESISEIYLCVLLCFDQSLEPTKRAAPNFQHISHPWSVPFFLVYYRCSCYVAVAVLLLICWCCYYVVCQSYSSMFQCAF